MNTEPPKDAPEYRVALKTWWNEDFKRGVWQAKLVYTEYRNGRQYGGAEVRTFTAKPNTTYRRFMVQIKTLAQSDIHTLWT